MASDQTPIPIPSAPNPNPNPTAPIPLPTPTPLPNPTPPASTARKLPIKRKSPLPSSPSSPSSFSGDLGPFSGDGAATSGEQLRAPPPFKFQRIWSESDELRFLQGLLGCGTQGLVFPRDLNVFYDQFSESMPQPYTRSQLSEKLRRLKNKYRSMAGRVARGLDPARLAPHDRDVLHLCSRLWDPAAATASPFAASAGASGNKRRRANPRVPPLALPAPGDENFHEHNGISSGAPLTLPETPVEEKFDLAREGSHVEDAKMTMLDTHPVVVKKEASVVVANGSGDSKEVLKQKDEHRVAKAVLDVFEECLREVKANGVGCGNGGGSVGESDLANRWRVQRIEELDVLSRRLRLLIEDAAAAGN